MANNVIVRPGWRFSVIPTNPVVVVSGGPIRYGSLTGVALTDEGMGGNAATAATVDFGPCVYSLPVTDHAGTTIALGAALFYVDGAPGTIENDPTGFFFGFALATVGNGATTTINVLHVPSPGAGTLGAGTIGTAHLAAGLISADGAGRALFAAGVFDAATALSVFGADTINNAFLLDAVLNGAFQADANTRALFADDIWPEAKIADGTLTANVVAEVADDNLTGGIPIVHRLSIADQATGNVDYVLVHGIRILQVQVVKRAAAGAGANTIQIQTAAGAAITDAMVINVNDNVSVWAATIDDATHEIADGGTLRVAVTRAAGTSGCDVYVYGLRVA
jgi:hypothetical protein